MFSLMQKALKYTGGLFSVALSLRLPWAAVNRHLVPKKSGLSSRLSQSQSQRLPAPLIGYNYTEKSSKSQYQKKSWTFLFFSDIKETL